MKTSIEDKFNFIWENFNVKFNGSSSQIWTNKLIEVVSRFPEGDIIQALGKINRMRLEEWNSLYGYGGKPNMMDWVDFFSEPEKERRRREEGRRKVLEIENSRIKIEKKKAEEVFGDDKEKVNQWMVRVIGSNWQEKQLN